MYANLAGFYLLALPLGVVLAFKVQLGLGGLLLGFLGGTIACLVLLLLSVTRIDWMEEAVKAQIRACCTEEGGGNKDEGRKNSKIADNIPLLQFSENRDGVKNQIMTMIK